MLGICTYSAFYFSFFNKKDSILKLFFMALVIFQELLAGLATYFQVFFYLFTCWLGFDIFRYIKHLVVFSPSPLPSHLSSFPSVPPSYFPVCMTCPPSYIFLCVWHTVFELMNYGEKCNKALLYHSFPWGKVETWIFTSHRLRSHLEVRVTPCSQQKTGEGLPEATWRD